MFIAIFLTIVTAAIILLSPVIFAIYTAFVVTVASETRAGVLCLVAQLIAMIVHAGIASGAIYLTVISWLAI